MLTTCFKCGKPVASTAPKCPRPECGLENPWDHDKWRAEEARKEAERQRIADEAARDAAEASRLQAELRTNWDSRSAAAFLRIKAKLRT